MIAPAPLSETLPAVGGSVARLRRSVVGFAANAGASEEALENIGLAVSEAVTNAVQHAYVGAERPGSIHVEARLGNAVLRVTVADDGRGMGPRIDSPGLGIGLALVARIAETFEVRRSRSGGAEVCMTFRLDDAERRFLS